MNPQNFLQRAGIPIVALALLVAPTVTWAQPSPPELSAQDSGRDSYGNNTTEPADGVHFVPAHSRKGALPGQTVHHLFQIVNSDDKKHELDIVANGLNDTAWSFTYKPDHVSLAPGGNASVLVSVTAPLLPDGFDYTVLVSAFEKRDELANATATTTYLLP